MFKKYIALLLALSLVLLSACGQKSAPKEEEKVPIDAVDSVVPADPLDLGIPTGEWYSYNLLARCVWDMTIYENKLYVGCGDYNHNTGGVPVMYCALDD